MQKLKAPAANRVTIQAAARLWWINMATVAYLNPMDTTTTQLAQRNNQSKINEG